MNLSLDRCIGENADDAVAVLAPFDLMLQYGIRQVFPTYVSNSVCYAHPRRIFD